MLKNNHFSRFVSVFHGRHLPEGESLLAGYSALIEIYNLQVPLPEVLSAISQKHTKYQKNDWMLYTPRHAPHESLFGQLTFALKNEGVNLSILKALFETISPEEINHIVALQPTGSYSRRIWFLYEWLQNVKLPLKNAESGSFVDALDDTLQYAGPSRLSKRHRVRNNLPGTPAFCPTIRKTPNLEKFIEKNLGDQARAILGKVHPDVLMRAAAFLLLKDSKSIIRY